MEINMRQGVDHELIFLKNFHRDLKNEKKINKDLKTLKIFKLFSS